MASRLGHTGAWPCTWVRGVQHGLACVLLELAGSWERADVRKKPSGTAGPDGRELGWGCSRALAREEGLVQCTCALREGERDSKLVRWFGANMQVIRVRAEETAAEPYVEDSQTCQAWAWLISCWSV